MSDIDVVSVVKRQGIADIPVRRMGNFVPPRIRPRASGEMESKIGVRSVNINNAWLAVRSKRQVRPGDAPRGVYRGPYDFLLPG